MCETEAKYIIIQKRILSSNVFANTLRTSLTSIAEIFGLDQILLSKTRN